MRNRISGLTVRRRLFQILIGGIVLFLALVIRLGYVQLWKGGELAVRAEESWRRNIPVTAKRGEILDRNGIRLAYNISSPTVMAIPAQIRDPGGTAEVLALALDMKKEDVYRLVTKRELIVRIQPGGRKISAEKAAEIRDMNLPGKIGRAHV